jgi:hypothetical protein
MPPNPNFARVPGAKHPAPRTPRMAHPSEREPTEAQRLREELERSRIALERIERRQRFSVGRVFALLAVILSVLVLLGMVL